ncbi:MAG: energy transducer TonB [Acidobacteria bacterium]|nr:energy transducer TonB [Acidobacteriota bacterium]
MFDEMIECVPQGKRKRNLWQVIFSFGVQAIIVVVLVLIPLIYTEALPRQMLTTLLVAPPPPPPPPPPPAAVQIVKVKPVQRLMNAGVLRAPTAIPKDVKMIKEEEMPPEVANVGVTGGVPGGVPGGQAGGVLGGIIGGIAGAPPPPKAAPSRIRVGGNVQQAMLVSQPKPIYPPLAKQARIQGTVMLQAIIAKDGSVQQVEMLSGHPLLVQSAMDAVRQWRYKPTLLNSEPVEVVTTVQVVFTLGS